MKIGKGGAAYIAVEMGAGITWSIFLYPIRSVELLMLSVLVSSFLVPNSFSLGIVYKMSIDAITLHRICVGP